MSGYAAGSSLAQGAYSGPAGEAAIGVGTASFHFLKMPMNFQVWQFLGIAFLIFVVSRHWGKFVNNVTK